MEFTITSPIGMEGDAEIGLGLSYQTMKYNYVQYAFAYMSLKKDFEVLVSHLTYLSRYANLKILFQGLAINNLGVYGTIFESGVSW